MDKRRRRTGERVIWFIRQYQADHNRPPTRREIAQGVGISSTSTIQRWLVILRDEGRIDWIERKAATVRVIEKQVTE
jgi:SOS-response transcriptional repressor LexA